ncbi:hypothetical protein SAMN05421812_1085 [Asanoa hainanensis]|uniref:Uncharacterized protein n=1 Tax=Asanoa hainanensis TaxID=560556 RepID=A0A239N8T5_9ACTN|nr:hypothetical protein [Asanoa hainanensis]SNT51326.1 hypothetical protein SAMN05421812_1085 [Asanoa hainanensis]
MTMGPESFTAGWTRLWRLAERLGGDPETVFAPVGLFLGDPTLARAWGYDCTPAHATTFAATGVNGVHFSLVDCEGVAPVVMTVPMAFDQPNHILAGDIREFLALGRNAGYFGLESLAYAWDRQDMINRLERGGPPDDPTEAALLGHLAAEFALEPGQHIARRMAQLETMYGARVRPAQEA